MRYSIYKKIMSSKYKNMKVGTTEESSTRLRPEEYTPEMLDILSTAKYDKDGNILAPNGKPSNLDERQWIHVRTKAFKDWFGDWENNPKESSKVVDENGEPLVVYHGTDAEDFYIFDSSKNDKSFKGFFFTDSKEMSESYGSNVRPFFLNIRESYEVNANNSAWNRLDARILNLSKSSFDKVRLFRNQLQYMLDEGKYPIDNYEYFNNKYFKYIDIYKNLGNNVIDIIKKKLLDIKFSNLDIQGDFIDSTRDLERVIEKDADNVNIIVRNVSDWGKYKADVSSSKKYNDVFVITNPNDVKSATDNTGTYSKENDDIRLRRIKEDNELFLENGYSENWIKNATEEEKEVAKYCIGI